MYIPRYGNYEIYEKHVLVTSKKRISFETGGWYPAQVIFFTESGKPESAPQKNTEETYAKKASLWKKN